MNNDADLKPPLIDLETDNTATGRKQDNSVQRERLSEGDDKYNVYWIHLENHYNPYTQGYIGITKDIKQRFNEHKKARHKYRISFAIKKYGWENLIKDVLFSKLSKASALEIERSYRPIENIGWNYKVGGDAGIPSDWYLDDNNKKKHSLNTSIATKKAIAEKDSREKRSARAINVWVNKPYVYANISSGSNNPKARLNEQQVYNIRFNLIPMGLSNSEIAAAYNVKNYVISQIKTNKTWKHVVCDSPDYK